MSLEYQRVVPQGANVLERTWRRIRAFSVSLRRLLARLRFPLALIVIAVLVYLLLLNQLEPEPKDPLQAILFVLELMSLEAAEGLPTHPAIIIFWLAMPILGLVVLGSVVEAILFSTGLNFNQEQRDLWEEAMASTFRDHIVVVALNDLSRFVISELSQRNYPVVVIAFKLTPNEDNWLSRMGIPSLVRSPRDIRDGLEKAGVANARSVLITTHDEDDPDIDMNEVNTIVARHAREINPNVAIIARIKDSTYARLLERRNVEVIPSISELAVWSFIGAVYDLAISQPIVVSEMSSESEPNFIVEMAVTPGSLLSSMAIFDVEADGADVMLHRPRGKRGRLVIPPPNEDKISAGDEIIVFAQQHTLRRLMSLNRGPDQPMRHVLVAGMNNLGFMVATALLNTGVNVHTLDVHLGSEEVTSRIMNMRAGRNGGVHLGHECSARWTRQILQNADVKNAQAIIICSGYDPENLRLASLAQEMVGNHMRIVARIGRDSYRDLYRELDVDAHLFRLSQVGASPFLDVAVGAEISPIEFNFEDEQYHLITLKLSQRFVDTHPRWLTVGDFQKDSQTDIVLLSKPGQPTDVHPEHHRNLQVDDTVVLFGPIKTVRRIIDSN